MGTKIIELKLRRKEVSSVSYRAIVREKLREAGRESDGDLFFTKAFIWDNKKYDNHLDCCVAIAKEFGIETVWETRGIIEILGTPETLGEDWPTEVRCPYECDGGDVCVNTETGICSVCKTVFDIQPTEIIVETVE